MIILKVLPHSNVSKMMQTERQTVVGLHCLPEYNGSLQYEPQHDKTNKMTCAPSEDSDQPGHPPSLIRVFAVCMKNSWALSYPMNLQGRLWSDWADAQADWVFTGRSGGFVMQRLICLLNNGTWNAWRWKWHEIEKIQKMKSFTNILLECQQNNSEVISLTLTYLWFPRCWSLNALQTKSIPVYSEHFTHPSIRNLRKLVYAIRKQQRCRSACAFAQSDQHLCCLVAWIV